MQNRKCDLILENIEAGYFYIDKDGIIRDVNEAWVKLYKYNSRKEIIGKHFAVIQKIDDYEQAVEFVNGIMAGNPEYLKGEFSRKCKDGTIGYHTFSAGPVIIDGNIEGIEGIIIDTTKRKNLEEELLKNKNTLEGYLNTAAEIVITLDTNGVITYLNESGHRLLDYEAGELIGKNWFDSCLPEIYQTEVKDLFKDVIKGNNENIRNYENQIVNKKGEIKTIYWHNTLLMDESGKINGTLSSGEDITTLKEAERQALRSEEFINSLLNAVPTPVFYKDRKGLYMGCNKAFTEIMGVTPKEMAGKSVFDLWPSEQAEMYHKKDLELMEKPEYQIYEFEVKDKHGKIRPVIYAKDVFYDEAGEVAGVVGAFLDISYQKQIEFELRKARADWENIFNSIADLTIIIDPDQTILTVNDAAVNALKLDREAIIGRKCHQVFHKKNTSPEGCPFKKLLKSKHPEVEQMEIEIFNGTFLVSTSPVLNENGELEKVIHYAKDITQITSLKKQIAERDARNSAILNAIPDIMFIFSKDGKYLDYHAPNKNMLYTSPENFIGKKVTEILPEEISREFHYRINKAITHNADQITYYKMDINNTLKTFEARIVPYEEDKVLSIVRDITERTNALDALKESEERMNLAIESTGLGLWDKDFMTGKIKRNDKWAEMLGYSLEEVEEDLDFYYRNVHPDDLQEVKQAIEDHKSGKSEIFSVEHRMKHKKGQWIWINNTGKIIKRDEAGNPLRALGIHEDVTARKEVEEQLRIGKQRLQILNKIIRHDLANDFNVIKSAVNLFKRKSEVRFIDEINKRVNTSLQTIKTYKSYEDFIGLNLNLEMIDLNEFLDKIIPQFPDLEIKISGSGKVLADQALSSVFKNLFTNSKLHGDASKIEINITSDIEFCKILVRDNGKGIPLRIRNDIFGEGFFHGKHGNTGIGLFIARQAIKNYGGEIYLADDQSKGAAFLVKLKRAFFRNI